MSFLVFFACGIAGGVLGGMGMGGGTVLIPLLTIFCGVEQSAAQGVNLLSFLPMSALAIGVHARSGLIVKNNLACIILPALVFSVLFSLLAAAIPSAALGKGFGVFLILLSFFQFREAFRGEKKKSAQKNFLKT